MDKNEKDRKKAGVMPFGMNVPEWLVDPFKGFESGNRLMQHFFNEGFGMPRIDIEDKGDSFVVTADLPDMDKKAIKVNVSNDSVAIKAERSNEREQKGKSFYARERASSGYYRVVQLPEEVNPNGAKAAYENGTLRIDIKKAKGATKHEVTVE